VERNTPKFPVQPNTQNSSPGGTSANSPALQRREKWKGYVSPGGTTELSPALQCVRENSFSGSLVEPSTEESSPGGTSANSPALQRREKWKRYVSPGGTTELSPALALGKVAPTISVPAGRPNSHATPKKSVVGKPLFLLRQGAVPKLKPKQHDNLIITAHCNMRRGRIPAAPDIGSYGYQKSYIRSRR
jgi:hypothetical protein